MGFLNDELPPNVYILGNPQVNDGWDRTQNGLDILRGGFNAVTGKQVGASTLAGALFSTAVDEGMATMFHWCRIDLNNNTIGIDSDDMYPLAAIQYAEIRNMPEHFIFGFNDKHWMGVAASDLSQDQKNLLKYIIQFTSLPADYYTIDPSVGALQNISKSHAQAYLDHFYR